MTLDRAFGIAASWVREGITPGCSIAVARCGELIGQFVAGKTSAGGGGPVTPDTLYSVASLTKPFTATLILQLAEAGSLQLDQSLGAFFPTLPDELAVVTLRDLLRHTSGLAKDDPDELLLWERQASFSETVASALQTPVEFPIGQRVSYSSLGYWVLGGLIAGVTGKTYPQALHDMLLRPMALSDTFITPGDQIADRMARRYGRSKIMNAPYGRQLGSPSGGMFATATDMVRFASAFLGFGDLPLSVANRNLMTTNQTGDLPGGIPGLQEWPVGPWGLGWEVKGPKLEHWTGDFTSPATFSHPGQSGCLLWADPVSGIACAILANRDLSTGWTRSPARWARLNNAIVAGLR